MQNYKIEREHHSEKTYNGYTDSPYWRVTLEGGQVIGLKDSGDWWKIEKTYSSDEVIAAALSEIVGQCNLNIKTIEVK